MCGIVGIVSDHSVVPRLIEGLKRVEYRGYDSAGIAVITDQNELRRCRAPGKIANLQERLSKEEIDGRIGIAHMRWATHGLPTEQNAHPHMTETVALVHNGIIENYKDLRHSLEAEGVTFETETDSETIVHLLTKFAQDSASKLEAVFKTVALLKGSYALGILFKDDPHTLYGVRQGSPLAVGQRGNEAFLGSDAIALSGLTQQVIYLEEGDVAVIKPHHLQIYDVNQLPALRKTQTTVGFEAVSKGPYTHFMLKEIHEQPDVIRQTLSAYLSADKKAITLPPLPLSPKAISRITIVACGTSYYAGLVAKHWLERLARLPVEVDIASEFRYRQPPLPENGVALFISQSGETADTLAAHTYAKANGQHTFGIINVPNSSLARAVDVPLLTYAGLEIGVASTKAFSAQLCILALLTLTLGHATGALDEKSLQDFLHDLVTLPGLVTQTLAMDRSCEKLAPALAQADHVLYLGRGVSYAIALEGALKLKEISYLSAEGYAAGEMKHGPIALIDDKVPVIVIGPHDELFEKLASNVQEAAARQGKIILLSDTQGQETYHGTPFARLVMPTTTALTAPLVYTIPVQLIAYYTALHKGTDVDQPRNLAKSVTVE